MKAPRSLSYFVSTGILFMGSHVFALGNYPETAQNPRKLPSDQIVESKIDNKFLKNVPEPSAALLGALGAFLLLRRRK